MKRYLISTVAALALLAGPALATTVQLGDLSSGYSNAFGGGSVHTPETFDFTIASNENLQLSATVSNTSVAMGATSLVLTGPTTESAAFTKGSSWNAAIGGSFPGTEIMAGSYSFTITPAVLENTSAAVGYSLNLSGVPEISTWAMMLAGLASMCLVGHRRKTARISA